MNREMTVEECRAKFLGHISAMVDFWLNESRTPDTREKMEGLAFSILVAIDGESSLPAFVLSPSPHPDDKKHHQDNDEDWWPEDADIAGPLHEIWCKPPYSHRQAVEAVK